MPVIFNVLRYPGTNCLTNVKYYVVIWDPDLASINLSLTFSVFMMAD